VIELARGRGLAVEEAELPPAALDDADELFLVGTGLELTPVVELDGRAIGAGTVGPVTAALATAYGELVRSQGTPIYPG
jgi:branched-chain amino acid aminotransferase